jgi:SAM-dependent methyltransferase
MTPDEKNDQMTRWDSTYSSNQDFFGKDASDFAQGTLSVFQHHKAKKILELGCGQGRDTLFLAETGLCQIKERSASKGLAGSVILKVGDARDGLPFEDGTFDGCFSHMFFTMQLTEKELTFIFSEVLRVLRPGGLNIYSVRNVHDPHFGKGKHFGEDMWQNPIGFVVHFFSEEKIRRLAVGYDLLWIKEFDDPSPPFTKKLYEVVLQKPGK